MKTETLVGVSVLLAALLSVGAYRAGVGLSGSQTAQQSAGRVVAASPDRSPDASADGPALFTANCAGCHGARAQGGVGPKLAGLSFTAPQFAGAVLGGQDPEGRALAEVMPRFKTVGFGGKPPTDGQMTAVLTFLKSL